MIAKREAPSLHELLWIIGALSFLITTAVILYVALQFGVPPSPRSRHVAPAAGALPLALARHSRPAA